jgi:hypothetical protein
MNKLEDPKMGSKKLWIKSDEKYKEFCAAFKILVRSRFIFFRKIYTTIVI